MKLLDRIFGSDAGPSQRQLRRAMKQVTETHGDATVRVGAMERLAEWGSPGAIATLLRRFTIQVPQGSMDLEEKQYALRLLTQIGRPAVAPILHYIKTEGEVTFAARALIEILPHDEYFVTMKQVLEGLGSYTRWPEAKAVLIQHLPDDAYALMKEVVLRYLEEEDDDVCIAAIDYLARNGEEDAREHLLLTLLKSESRPRVNGRILEHFCERDWPVKGYRKRVEELISDPFYLTSKGTVKRREI